MAKAKAIGLIRVSTARQADADHFGIPAQQASIEKLVKQYDLDIIETISYSDVSGADVMYAPEMRRVLQLIQRPDVNFVVAKEFSRLVRPGFEDYPLLQKFVEAHITLLLPSGPVDLTNAHGQFFATIQGAMAALELSTIKSRMMGGREEARKRGYCAAGGTTVPTGFRWDARAKTFSEDPIYLPNLLEAFRMIDEDGERNLAHIIRKLHLCLRPAKGGTPKLATHTSLRRLLMNRMYVGERAYVTKMDLTVPKEQLMRVLPDGTVRRRQRPVIAREPHEIIVRQVMQPVVSRERFERVQLILKAKSDKVRQTHALHQGREQFTYRGMLACGTCGSPMYTHFTKQFAYYRCRDHFPKRGTGKCPSRGMIRKDLMDAEIDRVFSQQFSQTQFWTAVIKNHTGSESRAEVARKRNRLQEQRETLTAKRGRIIEFALDGTISKPDRDRRLKLVDDDLQTNQQALAALQETPMPTFAEWQELMRPFRRGFAGLPVEQKRKLVAERFQEIRVRDGKVVSLYLMTGEVRAVAEAAAVTRKLSDQNCHTCGGTLTQDDLNYNRECDVDAPWRYCTSCLDSTPRQRAERQYTTHSYQQFQQVGSFCDTSLGL